MKKFLLMLILCCCSNMIVFADVITVPKDTVIKIAPTRKKSQKTIGDSYKVKAQILDDVYVDGVKVFETGGRAIINVVTNDKAKFFCKGGTLVLQDGYAVDIRGEKHNISFYKKIVGRDAAKVAKILIFKKGQNVILYPQDEITAKTSSRFLF